jgi:hypothetical protein
MKAKANWGGELKQAIAIFMRPLPYVARRTLFPFLHRNDAFWQVTGSSMW